MDNYWKKYYDTIGKKYDGYLLKQVGKTVNGKEIPENQIEAIIENISDVLQLNLNDIIIDLCCGNGLLTRRLAPIVNKVVGVDFTHSLIKTAKKYNRHYNIDYLYSDVLCLDTKYLSGSRKIVMYEALQHFSSDQMVKLLEKLCMLDSGSFIFLGSIPDKEKLQFYYDTEEKYLFYIERENAGMPHMGKWWYKYEIEEIASLCGFKALLLPQPLKLYTAYYRFDCLLEKK